MKKQSQHLGKSQSSSQENAICVANKLEEIARIGNALKTIALRLAEMKDEETGELKTKYRTILFDKSGQTYATGSYGIYNVLKKIVQIYGLPTSWEKPLKVKVSKRPIGNGKQSLTLTLV